MLLTTQNVRELTLTDGLSVMFMPTGRLMYCDEGGRKFLAVASFATTAIMSAGPIPDWKSSLDVPKTPLK